MAHEHVVKQGEYLAKIAAQYGIASWKVLWDAPENATLRARRGNPNVLYAGDRVVIPDAGSRTEPGSTEQRHRFRAKREPVRLKLLLEEPYRSPVSGADCELHLGAGPRMLATDSSGGLECGIDPTAELAQVVIRKQESHLDDVMVQLHIGHLDPVDTFTGQVGRLLNLGYLAQPATAPGEPDFISAVEEFQCDHKLTVDGSCGPKTQKQLLEVHGC